MKHFIYIVIMFSLGCANVVAPNGGIKDVFPPKVISMTPENYSTLANEKEITIEFDELIQFNDKERVFVSPFKKYDMDAVISKNKLIINFETDLKENTTYNINLDNVLKDVNEGNVLQNLNYIFSTGYKIDTLSIRGVVKDALTDEPLEGISILLYNNDMDSLLYKELPNYIAKSTKSGSFLFSNLALNSFIMYAIQDLDNNLRFTIPNEKVGFVHEKIVSQSEGIEMLLFDETAQSDTINTIRMDSVSNKFGKLIIDSLPSNSSLIVELIKNKKLVHRTIASYPTLIDSLLPGTYSLRIIKDENKNGTWDSGNLNNKVQAETVKLYPEEINIRENWDVVVEWYSN